MKQSAAVPIGEKETRRVRSLLCTMSRRDWVGWIWGAGGGTGQAGSGAVKKVAESNDTRMFWQ